MTANIQFLTRQDQHERRKHRRTKTLWPGKLETPLGCVECQVLNFTSRGAKVRVLQALTPEQSVSLNLDPLGRFPGVVVWNRNGCTGIRFTPRHAIGDNGHSTMHENPDKGATERVLERGSSSAPLTGDASRWNREPAGDATTLGVLDHSPAISPIRLSDGLAAIDQLQSDYVLRLEPGRILFTEGDTAGCMYVVKSGRLRIKSGQVVYEDVECGGIVGEMGLVDQREPRSATVYALARSEVIQINKDRFLSLVDHSPEFAIAVMRVLSRRLRQMNQLYRPERSAEPHR